MKNSAKKIASSFALIALLAACSSPPPARVATDFGVGTKTNLDVHSVTLTDRSGLQPSDSPMNTSHLSPTISEAVKQWATDHLQAAGSTGEAIVIIKDASIVQQSIPHEGQWFTREQTSKYSAHADIELQIKGRGDSFALATAQASRYETLPENPTEAEKQNAYATLLNGLIRDLGQSLEASMHDHLQHFILDAPSAQAR